MFDIGWMEMVVIGTVALVFVGPKDLPGMFRTMGQFMAKARGMAREFQRSMEQAANEAGLGEAGKAMTSLNRMGLDQATNSARDYAKSLLMGEAKPMVSAVKSAKPAVAAVAPLPTAAVKPKTRRKSPAGKPTAGKADKS